MCSDPQNPGESRGPRKYESLKEAPLGTQYQLCNGSLDVGTDALVAEYRYDGMDRRITKLLPNGNNWDRTDYYYNESWQCLEERFSAGQEDKDAVATTARKEGG